MGTFEVTYGNEVEIQRELENIEVAYAKTIEKYKKFESCLAFIDYLKTIERVFTEANLHNWDAGQSKEELIRVEISLLAARSHLSEEFFHAIYKDFQDEATHISKISGAVQKLLDKHQGEAECCEFIHYLGHVFLSFENIQRGGIDMIDVQTNLVKAKMKVISFDGDPNLFLLEQIYKDFQSLMLLGK